MDVVIVHCLIILLSSLRAKSYSGYYIGVNVNLNWTDANLYCEEWYNTTLATILSSNDNTAVRTAATNAGISTTSEIWIGLSDKAAEDTWVWEDGTSNTSYQPWYPNEPNHSGDCARQYQYSSGNLWDDTGCNEVQPFVCNDGE